MKNASIFILLFTVFQTYAQNIETVFPLKWKTKIGQTTYRTNILFNKNKIWVGSNGYTFVKNRVDDLDAVFSIDPKTGNILEKIIPAWDTKEEPDTDINGIAIEGNKLYFATDAHILYCYDMVQKDFLWQYNAPSANFGDNYGNIESCPLLIDLNNDAEKDIVITVRGRGIVALNGKNGKPLWVNILSESDGAYLCSPVSVDVNNDKIPDIISGGWGLGTEDGENAGVNESHLYALDGKNGKIIWEFNLGSGLKSSPVIVKKGQRTAIMVATTYSLVYMLGLDGKVLYGVDFQLPDKEPYYGGISGLYGTPVITPNETMLIGSSWWSSDQDGLWIAHLLKANLTGEEGVKFVDKNVRRFYTANRISASAVVGNITNKNWQIAIPTEKGELLIYDEKTRSLERLKMPSGAECTPFLGDIDGDKKLELLIASYDGYLYCYELSVKKAKVFIGQFRQNNTNQAEIRLK
ncbi:MAG: PQQ-like beta-propeller repeat protein [Raineya sp.]|jgi:outer membrane protein assembly factor BamB|nr:PQQ-like beta-propeller repeat protein [Raineya sp.]